MLPSKDGAVIASQETEIVSKEEEVAVELLKEKTEDEDDRKVCKTSSTSSHTCSFNGYLSWCLISHYFRSASGLTHFLKANVWAVFL